MGKDVGLLFYFAIVRHTKSFRLTLGLRFTTHFTCGQFSCHQLLSKHTILLSRPRILISHSAWCVFQGNLMMLIVKMSQINVVVIEI